MKNTFFISLCSLVVALTALGQTPVPPPPDETPAATMAASPAETVVGAPTAAPVGTAAAVPVAPVVASVTPAPTAPDNEEDFDKMVERKIDRHFRINIDKDHWNDGDDVPWIAVPIVLIVFLTIFGLPVAIVGLILYFSFSRSRALHKTVRMMVEKGQPVPEALLNPPPVVRQRSDLRRGVILCVIGAGLMVFFGAVNDWEGGAWSLGFIPFIIGLGYLVVWKLDVRKEETSPTV